ncbi:hypothetical protein [Streptosporangium sp. NBC_01756]|nr:hypothetical protein [Streptosporangium sp. NBC_01756]WSC89646.1 hypothetical protein OIE48_16120 [Streptosporangium sp. NBC_01756]
MLEHALANRASHDIDELAALAATKLKQVQHRPVQLNDFIAQAGCILEPP